MEYKIIEHEEQVLGRLSMIRGHGWDGEAYAHMLLLDMLSFNDNILPEWIDSVDRRNWPELRQIVDAADYDLNTYRGFDDAPWYPEPISPLMGRIAFLRAHGWSEHMLGPLDALDFTMGNDALLVGVRAVQARAMIDAASYGLDVLLHDEGACPKMQFLEDPITREYGVGSEFVDGIRCAICENRNEPPLSHWV